MNKRHFLHYSSVILCECIGVDTGQDTLEDDKQMNVNSQGACVACTLLIRLAFVDPLHGVASCYSWPCCVVLASYDVAYWHTVARDPMPYDVLLRDWPVPSTRSRSSTAQRAQSTLCCYRPAKKGAPSPRRMYPPIQCRANLGLITRLSTHLRKGAK